jgi:hypothetical protein
MMARLGSRCRRRQRFVHHICASLIEPKQRIRRQGAFRSGEVAAMVRFLKRYVQYRRVGFGRFAAFRYAWLVSSSGRPLQPIGR